MWEIKTLGRADDERARDMLEKTAWQVQPIMRKRGWRVGVLLEMPAKVRDRLGDNSVSYTHLTLPTICSV